MIKLDIKEWKAELESSSCLEKEEDFDSFGKHVSMVTGKESQEVFQALIDAINPIDDLGAYEGVHNALWKFPPKEFAEFMIAALPNHIDKMGSSYEHNVGRFLCPLVGHGKKTYLPAFIAELESVSHSAKEKITDYIERNTNEWFMGESILG